MAEFVVFLDGKRTVLDMWVDDEGCYRVTSPDPDLANLDLRFNDPPSESKRAARQTVDTATLLRRLHRLRNPEVPRDI